MVRVLGVDPGYDRVGVAIVEKTKEGEQLVFSDCITTPTSDSFAERIRAVGESVANIIEKHTPDVLAIEKTFFSKNQKTAIAVSEARGVILYEAARAELSIFEYSPPEVKVAVTGYGNSDKGQIAEMVPKLISIEKKIAFDDEFDAIAVALTHLATDKTAL